MIGEELLLHACAVANTSYIDQTDQDTKSTFSLLLELSRLEVLGKPGSAPLLTLPLSGK